MMFHKWFLLWLKHETQQGCGCEDPEPLGNLEWTNWDLKANQVQMGLGELKAITSLGGLCK